MVSVILCNINQVLKKVLKKVLFTLVTMKKRRDVIVSDLLTRKKSPTIHNMLWPDTKELLITVSFRHLGIWNVGLDVE